MLLILRFRECCKYISPPTSIFSVKDPKGMQGNINNTLTFNEKK